MPDWIPVPGISTVAGTPLANVFLRDGGVTPDADPKTCSYLHFNLAAEQLGRTRRYNCWGFTFLPRRYWINSAADVDTILADNCNPIPDGSVHVGDVVRYRDSGGVTTHTGRVWQTDGAGHATKVRSKWGGWAEYIHDPLDVPEIYGTSLAYFRQHAPLRGIPDLWIKDAPGDTGEQSPGAPWWTSPDILLDVPPYDGSPDLQPVFGHANRVWTVVRNRSDHAIEGVYVRYYWADPAAGLPPASWHLIPGTAGHPNPAGPLAIPALSSVEVPYVEWTPMATPAHQCLLASAYVNDDPQDSGNPDPLVYPFEIPWENNIGQRNVHVTELATGDSAEIAIDLDIPFPQVEKAVGALHALVTFSPRVPSVELPRTAPAPKVTLTLGGRRVGRFLPWEEYLRAGGLLRPDRRAPHEQPLVGAVIPRLRLTRGDPSRLDIRLTIPGAARRGTVYYLHIAQQLSGALSGGYTVVAIVG